MYMSWHFLRIYLIFLCDIIVSLLVLCLWLLVPLMANLCLCQMYIAKYLLLRKEFSYCSSCVCVCFFFTFLYFKIVKNPKFYLYFWIKMCVFLKYSFHVELHLIFLQQSIKLVSLVRFEGQMCGTNLLVYYMWHQPAPYNKPNFFIRKKYYTKIKTIYQVNLPCIGDHGMEVCDQLDDSIKQQNPNYYRRKGPFKTSFSKLALN